MEGSITVVTTLIFLNIFNITSALHQNCNGNSVSEDQKTNIKEAHNTNQKHFEWPVEAAVPLKTTRVGLQREFGLEGNLCHSWWFWPFSLF